MDSTLKGKIKVRAKDGVEVPLEGNQARRFDAETGRDVTKIGGTPVVVDATTYYRRRIAKGDLLVVPETEASPAKPIKKGKEE